MKIKKKLKTIVIKNELFLFLTGAYIILLFCISIIACMFAYRQKKEEVTSQMDRSLYQLEQEYLDISKNFWQIYMPLFESSNTVYSTFSRYFTSDSEAAVTPLDKLELKQALSQMTLRDNRVQWIALYSYDKKQNYIYFSNGFGLQALPSEFPYTDYLKNTNLSQMEILGLSTFSNSSGENIETFAICGGIPQSFGNGRLIAGYSITAMERVCKNNPSKLSTLDFFIISGNNLLFSTTETEDILGLIRNNTSSSDILITSDNEKLYYYTNTKNGNVYTIGCIVSWDEFAQYIYQDVWKILAIDFAFIFISLIIYIIMVLYISKEVNIIRSGLHIIGKNNLNYRFPIKFKQSGLTEIATSINNMTTILKNNINRAYFYQLKQKEAELSELQTKFNPHFLYNTLEMLRSKSYQNGDPETAELISQLAALFRGFIGSNTFIPIKEELAFSEKYLSLFSARYGDTVQILYDIDTDVLKYGIIRNIFQPLIENYFLHGIDTSSIDNYLLFRGKSKDDNTILITIEDNGIGMTDDKLVELNNKLHKTVKFSSESYGLKNLHQRLQLFYGDDCGLIITHNGDKGLRIQITIKKMTYEEYEHSKLMNIEDNIVKQDDIIS